MLMYALKIVEDSNSLKAPIPSRYWSLTARIYVDKPQYTGLG